MKILLATLALAVSLFFRLMPKYTITRKKKKVISKKQNNYIHRSLQARIHTLQVIGEFPTSSDFPDN